jgi:hypothetical protein
MKKLIGAVENLLRLMNSANDKELGHVEQIFSNLLYCLSSVTDEDFTFIKEKLAEYGVPF